MRAHALLYLAGLSATLLWGCFSGDDFSDCQEDRQCGPARFCKQGECVFKDSITVYDSGLPPAPDAARPAPDAALEVVILGESTLSGTTNKGEVHLRLDQEATVAPLSREGGGGGFVELQAAIVEITGRINGQGAGEPGGGGGGGGGGRVNSSAEDSIGGVGGIGPTSRDEAEAGHAGTAAAAGQGGQGRDGGGVCGGAGGLPGGLDAPEGAAGEAGRRVEALACVSPTTFYYGCGGGGGGGAAGLGDPGGQDRNGFGGGGGGAGGRGGGAIFIVASQEIIIRGALSVGGAAAPQRGNAQRNGSWITGGLGGSGVLAIEGVDGPGQGADDTGRLHGGGLGGPGAGGMIYLAAPKIRFEPGAVLDLRGDAPEGSRGYLILETNDVEGPILDLDGVELEPDCRLAYQ